MLSIGRAIAVLAFSLVVLSAPAAVYADAGHSAKDPAHNDTQDMIENLRKLHKSHQHGHDFEVMQEMAPEQFARMLKAMRNIGLAVPQMDAAHGRKLFADTGCIVCHSVNGIGGEIGPSLNAADMPAPMNAFEFAARMWRGAAAMTAMQEEMFGGVIELSGQDLADLIAFAHDDAEQKKLTDKQIPQRFLNLLNP